MGRVIIESTIERKKCQYCNGTTSPGQWYSGPTCRRCYHRLHQHKAKLGGPCTKCKIKESKHWYDGPICGPCWSKTIKLGGPCIKCSSTKSKWQWYKGPTCRYCWSQNDKIGGPCSICGSTISRMQWYDGPTCRNCYMRDYAQTQHQSNLQYRIRCALRSRLYSALKNNAKVGSAVRDLGCSIPELKLHLESLFKPGMSWDNYGLSGWHIDHIIPLSSFDLSNVEQFKKACHYTNLQPLLATENLSKGGKLQAAWLTDRLVVNQPA